MKLLNLLVVTLLGFELTACSSENRDIGELYETRVSPPYFQLKAGCKLPELNLERGLIQYHVIRELETRSPADIVLLSDPDGPHGRMGYWEDHSTPVSTIIRNSKRLYLHERNLSLIDSKAVREIADMHCNKGATYGGIIANQRSYMGPMPDRLHVRIEGTPRPGQPYPFEEMKNSEPITKPDKTYGVIACFELGKVKNLLVVNESELLPWLDPQDEPICKAVDWNDYPDNDAVIYIE